MDKKSSCPDRADMIAWLDNERQDEIIANHISNCHCCKEFVEEINNENALITLTLDSLPLMPDLSRRIMAQVTAFVYPRSNVLFSVLSYLLILSSSFVLFLLYQCFIGFFTISSWSVALIKIISYTTNLMVYGSIFYKYISGWVLSGKPLIPSLLMAAVVMSINILQKRRLSNV